MNKELLLFLELFFWYDHSGYKLPLHHHQQQASAFQINNVSAEVSAIICIKEEIIYNFLKTKDWLITIEFLAHISTTFGLK